MFPNIRELNKKNPLAEHVLGFIQKYNLIPKGETLVVGVSGGPDSICLLHLLVELQEELEVRLHIAHLDHMLRGEESKADTEYVSMLCCQLGVEATIEQQGVGSYQAEHRLSLEDAAREIRYRFFAQVAQAQEANRVAVGHTADDQVETILMHLVRGTGAHGLHGMQPLTSWKLAPDVQLTVARPLLEVSRSETEAYCQEHHLTPRQDSSNLSNSYFRNRIRHELIPRLQSYNPNIKRGLLHTAQTLAEECSFIEEQLSPAWDKVVSQQNGALALNISEISQLHPALQRYLLREVLRHLLGDLRDIERKHIEKVREALSLPAGKQLSLPRGLTISVEYNRCVIGNASAISPPFPALKRESPLRLPGKMELPGWSVETTIQARDQLSEKNLFQKFGLSPTIFTACLDFEATGNELLVRGRKPGDRFQPLGMSQPKKLQDFMVDAHIPRTWRNRVPLVCSSQQILWVVGWRIDDRVRVTENTKQILRLRFEREDCLRRSRS